MIFLINSNGQFGNRLLMSSHAISYALANREIVIDLGFFRYAKYFEMTQAFSKKKVIIVGSSLLSKVITKLLLRSNFMFGFLGGTRLLDTYSAGWVHTELKGLGRKGKILLLIGEGFRDTENLLIHKNSIKQIFTPREKYRKLICSQVEKYRYGDSLLVGVHIRRGDYKHWMGGKYYFQDDVYEEAIRQFNHLQSQKKIIYLLFSDESIKKENYKSDNILISTNPMIVDLYLLSECDFIIGPPSTFSGWASFYGNVPLFHFTSKEFEMKLTNFNVYKL